MKLGIALIVAFSVSACGQLNQSDADDPIGTNESGSPISSIEAAAIEAGVIPDVNTVTLSGAFERQSELGIDRFCAVGNDERGYQIGMLAVFGPESKCEALGEAQRQGEAVSITLNSKDRCSFTASFDGVELKLPGSLPETCASYCSPRAVFEGVSFYLVGEGDAVARSTRGRDIDNLCPGG